MRVESSVTAVSWIPSEAVRGLPKMPFEVGITRNDRPPPDVIEDLERLRASDGFRFANELRAWIEVDEGRILGWGHSGSGHIGSTTVRLGKGVVFAGVPFPEIRPDPEVSPTAVRFVQTAGGRTGLPAVMGEGKKPNVRELREGRRLVTQGEPGTDVFLLLDGVLAVEINGEKLGEVGPGAILGARAVLER